MNTTLPSLFVSHGSPLIALQPGAAGAFLQRLGPAIAAAFGRPKAILGISAHTGTRAPVLLAAERHEAIHDFGNFDERLFELRYDAPGAPDLAPRVAGLIEAAGLPVHAVPQGGLDHGFWTALRYVYPEADVPILPLAYVPSWTPAQQFALGQALAPLRDDGVLVFASGSITHNLRRVFSRMGERHAVDLPEIPESLAFRSWLLEKAAARDWEALFAYRGLAPHAADMHPTDEHLLPWYVAAGAGGREHAPQRLHDSVTYGALAMDAYAFGAGAARLQQALADAPVGA